MRLPPVCIGCHRRGDGGVNLSGYTITCRADNRSASAMTFDSSWMRSHLSTLRCWLLRLPGLRQHRFHNLVHVLHPDEFQPVTGVFGDFLEFLLVAFRQDDAGDARAQGSEAFFL